MSFQISLSRGALKILVIYMLSSKTGCPCRDLDKTDLHSISIKLLLYSTEKLLSYR